VIFVIILPAVITLVSENHLSTDWPERVLKKVDYVSGIEVFFTTSRNYRPFFVSAL